MARIQFFEGYSWDSIPPTQVIRMIPRAETIEGLKKMRQEWEQAATTYRSSGNAGGQPQTYRSSLLDIPVSLGFMLSDICDLLKLEQAEREAVLGEALYLAFEAVVAADLSVGAD